MKFTYLQPNGVLAIVHPAPKAHLERLFGEMTDAQYRQHVISRSIPKDAADVREVAADYVHPAPRTLRNAWVHDGVDMAKAREVWRDHMRRARAPIFAALDIEAQRSLETDGIIQEHTRKDKQALREAPGHPDIESATTPEQLMAIWPSVLGEKPA